MRSYSDRSLDVNPPYRPKTVRQFLKYVSNIREPSKRLSELEGYQERLGKERKKIELFQTTIPICMLLLNEAMEDVEEEKKKCKSFFDIPPFLARAVMPSDFKNRIEHQSTAAAATNVQWNSELVSKKRMRWSPDLHLSFLRAVRALGGAEEATPKEIKKRMKVDGLTNDEVKSHLQKHRLHLRKSSVQASTAATANEQVPHDSIQSTSQSSSPHGPLQISGTIPGISNTGAGDGGEDEGGKKTLLFF